MNKVDGVVDVVGPQAREPRSHVDRRSGGRRPLRADRRSRCRTRWPATGSARSRPTCGWRIGRFPVRVRLPDSFRFDPNKLANTLIRTADGKAASGLGGGDAWSAPTARASCCARTCARWRSSAAASRDAISAALSPRSESSLDTLKLPIGYTYEIGGQYQAQGQAFRELLMVFALAVLLVFMILVSQFRAWVPALLILLAAPLSLGGALLLLWMTGTDLNISSAMGLILLVGLVVKNGIMLLDFSEKLHAEGEPFETAIAHAGRIRLRPILMTTFCTLFGLLPLALGLGAGAELQKPLALAVIGGLALSTPVTLLAVPGLYAAIKRWQ